MRLRNNVAEKRRATGAFSLVRVMMLGIDLSNQTG